MKRFFLYVGAVLLLTLFGAVLILSRSDWNLARPWLGGEVSKAIDRPFAINGDLTFDWVSAAKGSGWWLPRPRLSAEDIAIGNPTWAERDQLATIGRVAFVIEPLSLFRHTVLLPQLDIEAARVVLERAADGRNNWTFAKQEQSEQPSAWRVAFGSLRIAGSRISLVDEQQRIAIDSRIDTAAKGIVWQLVGDFAGAEVSGQGSAGSLLALGDKRTPYPVDARLQVGDTVIAVKGELTNPSQPVAVDVQLEVAGASMAQLYPLTRIVLPETAAFATAGHLTGALGVGDSKWRYENFTGKVGGSDIGGTIVYDASGEPPSISGELVSQQLLFTDLAPLIGADSAASKQRRGAAVEQPEDKALPVEPFHTERWRSMDAAVKFTGRKIVRDEQLPVNDLYAEIQLKDGVLTFAPLRFGVAGGSLIADLTLDGGAEPLQAKMKFEARGIKLKELLPTLESMQASVGALNGRAALSATGNSVAALLGSADGEVKLLLDRGTVSKFLLEAAGLNIANLVINRLFGDRQVDINCIAGGFQVENGLMSTRGFLIDTAEASIQIDGEIDLAGERLGLTLKPESKGLRLLSLRAPLYVTGTFKEPDVGVDKSVLALRAGGAAVLGAVAAPAALLPLIGVGGDEADQGNGCIAVLKEAREAPQAPPPGESPAEGAVPGKP
jgi:uncharacterized protein involved in outer membrane biogenesis